MKSMHIGDLVGCSSVVVGLPVLGMETLERWAELYLWTFGQVSPQSPWATGLGEERRQGPQVPLRRAPSG